MNNEISNRIENQTTLIKKNEKITSNKTGKRKLEEEIKGLLRKHKSVNKSDFQMRLKRK